MSTLEQRRRWRLNWYNKNKDKKIRYANICKSARIANPIVKPCSVAECKNLGERHHPDYSKPKEIVWLCKKHHVEEHASKRVKKVCKEFQCKRLSRCRGLCKSHYCKLMKTVNPRYLEQVREASRRWKIKNRSYSST